MALEENWPLCFFRPPIFVCFAYLWTLWAGQAGGQLGGQKRTRSHRPFQQQLEHHQLQRPTWPEVDLLMPLLHNYTSEMDRTTDRVQAQWTNWKAAGATDDSLQHRQSNWGSMRCHLAGGLGSPSLVFHALIWNGMAWMACHGLAWPGLVRPFQSSSSLSWSGLALANKAWPPDTHGMVSNAENALRPLSSG